MTGFQGAPRERSTLTPWLIGCGALIVVGIVGTGGASWYWLQKSMLSDPAKIATLAAEIVPGAKVPAGLVAKWGIDTFVIKVAVFGPPNGRADGEAWARGMVIVLASGPERHGASEQMTNGDTDGDVEVESLGVEKKLVGGVELEFEKSRSVQDGVEMLHYDTELPIPGGKIALLKILGPKAGFDHDAMAAFLAGIESLAPPRPGAPAKTGQPTEQPAKNKK